MPKTMLISRSRFCLKFYHVVQLMNEFLACFPTMHNVYMPFWPLLIRPTVDLLTISMSGHFQIAYHAAYFKSF